nr:hypothetical protein [Cupriavidus taiwanensis]
MPKSFAAAFELSGNSPRIARESSMLARTAREMRLHVGHFFTMFFSFTMWKDILDRKNPCFAKHNAISHDGILSSVL